MSFLISAYSEKLFRVFKSTANLGNKNAIHENTPDCSGIQFFVNRVRRHFWHSGFHDAQRTEPISTGYFRRFPARNANAKAATPDSAKLDGSGTMVIWTGLLWIPFTVTISGAETAAGGIWKSMRRSLQPA